MPIEQALEELKKYAKEFASVGDAKQAIQNDKEDFLHRWGKVNQYYKYVINNTKSMSDDWWTAMEIITDIVEENPSLDEWAKQMTVSSPKKTQTQSQNKDSIDLAAISGPIESLVSEVQSMQHWDPNHIGDVEWQLQQYRGKLLENKNSFEPNVYQSLMNGINAALDKIGRFNSMINSEAMEDIKRK